LEVLDALHGETMSAPITEADISPKAVEDMAYYLDTFEGRNDVAATLRALRASLTASEKQLEEARKCFEAAHIEGWTQALSDENVSWILELWERRIRYAEIAVAEHLQGDQA
jgi:hypothetical protein